MGSGWGPGEGAGETDGGGAEDRPGIAGAAFAPAEWMGQVEDPTDTWG